MCVTSDLVLCTWGMAAVGQDVAPGFGADVVREHSHVLVVLLVLVDSTAVRSPA